MVRPLDMRALVGISGAPHAGREWCSLVTEPLASGALSGDLFGGEASSAVISLAAGVRGADNGCLLDVRGASRGCLVPQGGSNRLLEGRGDGGRLRKRQREGENMAALERRRPLPAPRGDTD